MSIEDIRQRHMAEGFDETDLTASPFSLFEQWYSTTMDSGLHEPTAMSVATVDENAQPWQRFVLLKLFDEKGFVFFTNYESRKASHIANNARVSLLFPWYPLGRQVSVTGKASKIPTAESLAYFITRPRGSQLGAWASGQSKMINSRSVLETAVESIKRKYANHEVPLPPFWGGYRVVPRTMEFWQARDSRLHDRFIYTLDQAGNWSVKRLAP
jgi:pyridoxamine 5'-phosphate oxidase